MSEPFTVTGHDQNGNLVTIKTEYVPPGVSEKRRPGRPKGSLTKLKAKIAAIANEENDNE